MTIFNNCLIKWRYHCWFISLKMWLIVSQSKGLVHCFFFHFIWTFSTTMICATTLNNNWGVVQWKHDLLGNSRKYPYHTMDSFLEFQGQGGFFELEIRRHGRGITHFGNCEGKGRLWKYERGRTELSQVNNGISLWILPKVYCLKFWMTSFHSIKFNGCKMMCMK